MSVPNRYKGILLLGGASFVSAALLGIWRLALFRGFLVPPLPDFFPPHGNLMIGGFLATLIMFERMIALQITWLVWVPYVYGGTALFLHTGNPAVQVLHVASLAGWLMHRWMAAKKFRDFAKPLVESCSFIAASGALLYPGGTAASPVVALAALSFPVSTIAVERLELALKMKKAPGHLLVGLLCVWSLAWISSAWSGMPGIPVMGILTFLMTAMIFRFDVQAHLKGQTGIHKFLARALVVAYIWLFVVALSLIGWNIIPWSIRKDLVFHFLGLGFIFTMILAHAPLILPAVFGRSSVQKPPERLFWLFQTTTLLRIIGDVFVFCSVALWKWTGMISGVLHLILAVSYFVTVALRSRRQS